MKYSYLSPYDFEKHCPCSSYLTAYAESVSPGSAIVRFCKGSKSKTVDGKYTAEYDVIPKAGQESYILEVSCTQHSDHSYSYETLKKTGHQ